jgi:hypothetical protein
MDVSFIGGKKYHAVDTRHGGDAFLSCSAAAATWQCGE